MLFDFCSFLAFFIFFFAKNFFMSLILPGRGPGGFDRLLELQLKKMCSSLFYFVVFLTFFLFGLIHAKNDNLLLSPLSRDKNEKMQI